VVFLAHIRWTNPLNTIPLSPLAQTQLGNGKWAPGFHYKYHLDHILNMHHKDLSAKRTLETTHWIFGSM
jgi:hypothetical protein